MANILIIEDSSFQRNLLSRMVAGAGHAVTEATNGKEGLDRIILAYPDLVLCDLLMPEMGGLELLEQLKEQDINVPVIIVTANIQESVRTQCMDLGIRAFLNKPPNEAELMRAVGEALALSGGAT